jgi:uncharacterized protein YgiM (DUF1202 family)
VGKYKKIKTSLFCIILLCLFGSIVYEEIKYLNAESAGTVSVSGTLNVREGAGTNYKIIGSLSNGTKITILEDTGNGWYKIQYNSITGYVSSQYVIMQVVDEAYKQQLITSGFPESYANALALLHAKYPKWEFVPMKTGLEWNSVIANETLLGKNNVLSSSISSWKSVEKGAYSLTNKTWVAMDGASWVPASKGITEYYMDPRNFLDATNIFQFLNHTYANSKQNEATLSAMVSGTFLANTYKENSKDIKYSSTLIQAAEKSSVNPYILASMILVEQGNNGQGNSISQTVKGYEGYCNYFNIGAYATSTMSAVERGLWFAKGSGINATTYDRPWNSVTNAIFGGAVYYGNNYVQAGQNTHYLKKFNVQGSFIYNHQYMTNIQGAAAEAQKLANAYTSIHNSDLTFYIPVYDNMPAHAAAKPTGNGNPNNYLKNLAVDGYSLNPVFNVYTQEYSLIINSENSKVHIIAEPCETTSTVSGVGDVTLSEGMNNVNITVKAQNGLTRTYQLIISKTGGTTGNENEGNSESGNLTDTIGAYTVENGYLTEVNQMVEVETLKSNLDIADVKVTVYRSDKEITSGYVGTGCTVRISDTSNKVLEEYTILINGDLNGDGKITIADLLKMQKVILGLEQVSDVYSLAADVNQDGKTSIADLLKIQKNLLDLENISQ